MVKRILCIWLPDWPIQRLRADRPELKTRPLILYAPDARRGQWVVACSLQARRLGVGRQMPLSEATSLLERGLPDPGAAPAHNTPSPTPAAVWHVAAHDPRADEEKLTQLARWCERFSPIVGWQTIRSKQPKQKRPTAPAAAEDLYLEVTNLGCLFGDERTLADEICTSFRGLGYRVHVGVADTIGAAWAAAHWIAGRADSIHNVSESGNGASPPAWIAPGQQVQALQNLPLEALRLCEQTVQLLQRLGVLRIEQLTALPRASLSARLGDEVLQRLHQAWGSAEERIQAHPAPLQFQAQQWLEHPVRQRSAMERILQQLLQQVARQLMQHQRGAVQLGCRLDGSDRRPVWIQIGLCRPTAVAEHLQQLLRLQLESLTLPEAVEGVSVQAMATAPLDQRQSELFGQRPRETPRQLALLVDRLSNRLGRESVVRPHLQADAQPERVCHWVPLAEGRSLRRRGQAPLQLELAALDRPLQLCCPPLPLQVVAVAPDGPPIRWSDGQRTAHVVRHWGPERIETAWWRGRSIRRDYYRVESQTGHRFWLFRRLSDGKWFLQGEFA